MKIRQSCAENFYSGNIPRQIESFLQDYRVPEIKPVAGIVPHAGWMFSGGTAAKVFSSFANEDPPETIIIFGAVHNTFKVIESAVYPDGEWYTPIGEIDVDSETAETILEHTKDLLTESYDAHFGEHSIEVQLPFIRFLMPQTKIVPVAVLPDKNAHIIGDAVAEAVLSQEKHIVAVASTDLTHYGRNYNFAPAGTGDEAKEWMCRNDKSIIDKALNLEIEDIVAESKANLNACGAGAIAAVAAFAKRRGSEKGTLIEYITSHDIMPDPVFNMAVGYAGIIYGTG